MAWASSLLFVFVWVAPAWAADVVQRPAQWAHALSITGLPNLHQVTPALYRSAQPGIAGLSGLQQLGIRTVLSLRESDTDAVFQGHSDLVLLRYPLRTWAIEEDDVLAVLRVLNDPHRQPVLLHCKHGADRTGLMIASYRVVVQGWSKHEALTEMTQGGYGFHPMWRSIERRLMALDVARLKAALAAPEPAIP